MGRESSRNPSPGTEHARQLEFARLDREGCEQNALGRCRAAAAANCLRGLHLIRDWLSPFRVPSALGSLSESLAAVSGQRWHSGRHSFLPIDLRNSPREDLILVHLALVNILIDRHTCCLTFAESFDDPESFRKFYWTFSLAFNPFVRRKTLLFHFSPPRWISRNFSCNSIAIQLLLALWQLCQVYLNFITNWKVPNLRSVAQKWLSILHSARVNGRSGRTRILRFIIEHARLCYRGAPLLSRLQRVRLGRFASRCGAFEREGIVRRADDAISAKPVSMTNDARFYLTSTSKFSLRA